MFWLLLPTIVVVMFSGILWGWAGFLLASALLLTLAAWWSLRQRVRLLVPELEVAVIVDRRRQAFARFLPPGRHRLWPFAEQVAATIPLTTQTAEGQARGLQASGGLQLTVEWSLAYTLNPERVRPALRPKAARLLPRKSPLVAQRHMNHCLQHVVGDCSLAELCQPGVHRRLERAVRQRVAERLASLGFEIVRVMIGSIEMPAQVAVALAAVHERQMQVSNEAQALEQLQRVVSRFSEGDMQRLMELERIHRLGQNGVTLLYELPWLTGRATQPGQRRAARSRTAGSHATGPIVLPTQS